MHWPFEEKSPSYSQTVASSLIDYLVLHGHSCFKTVYSNYYKMLANSQDILFAVLLFDMVFNSNNFECYFSLLSYKN